MEAYCGPLSLPVHQSKGKTWENWCDDDDDDDDNDNEKEIIISLCIESGWVMEHEKMFDYGFVSGFISIEWKVIHFDKPTHSSANLSEIMKNNRKTLQALMVHS